MNYKPVHITVQLSEGDDCETCGLNYEYLEFDLFQNGRWSLMTTYGCFGGVSLGTHHSENIEEGLEKALYEVEHVTRFAPEVSGELEPVKEALLQLLKRHVWKELRKGVRKAQDDSYLWVRGVFEEFQEKFDDLTKEVLFTFLSVPGETRAEQAKWITRNVPPQLRGIIFALLDGKPITDLLWKLVEPKRKDAN